MISEEGYTIKGVQKNLGKAKKVNCLNNEEEYLQLLREIKRDIYNIIND